MKYVAIDELEHFHFHDAEVESFEWNNGDILWHVSALNAKTTNSQNDSPKDLCIDCAEMVLVNARIEKIAEPGYIRTENKAVQTVEENVKSPDAFDAVLQEMMDSFTIMHLEPLPADETGRQRTHVEILCPGSFYEVIISFEKSIVRWDAYSGLAYYEKWRLQLEEEAQMKSMPQ